MGNTGGAGRTSHKSGTTELGTKEREKEGMGSWISTSPGKCSGGREDRATK